MEGLVFIALCSIFIVLWYISHSEISKPHDDGEKPKPYDAVPAKEKHKSETLIIGKTYVIDGDTLKIANNRIRIEGIDAPELGQPAKDKNRVVFDHGNRVRSDLIDKIGGKEVEVTVKGYDKYERIIGLVTCDGKDVGEWLVRSGRAIAAYGDQYKSLERQARKEKRGIWGCDESYDPGLWRHIRRFLI